jgi:predicted O-methyltransferase YrrM
MSRAEMRSQIPDLIIRRFKNNDRKGQREAEEWCSFHSVDLEDVYQTFKIDYIRSFNEQHQATIEKSTMKVKNINLEMGGAGALDLLYRLVKGFKPHNVLETGVSYGWSGLAILLAMEENGQGQLVSTDMPYPKMNNEDFVGLVIPEHLHTRWQLLRIPDKVTIPKVMSNTDGFDLIHYDSDKSYEGRKWAYPTLWEGLVVNGIFISDDISDNIAFKEFCDSIGIKPMIVLLNGKFVGIMEKSEA